MRIVVLGGGFGGVTAVRQLEKRFRRSTNVEITLVSRENFFVLTPLLFEACSGSLELRHCAQPIRATLRQARFVEAMIEAVDVQKHVVRATASEGATYELPFDHLVISLGASTNDRLIPGSANALTFKTMADALVLRNRLIARFEQADAAGDTAERPGCLTVVVIGGGLVGVELIGELTAFADDVLRFYPRIRRDEVRFMLCEAGPRILPDVDERLAATAMRVLRRRGVDLRLSTRVLSIEIDRVQLEHEVIDAGTIVLAAGIVPSVVASAIPVLRDARGRIVVDGTMQSRSHPHVWALGDCAAVPDPDGGLYPALAQHTVRQARLLADNIRAVVDKRRPSAVMSRSLGTMASLGHTDAVARVLGLRLTGFLAWWVRRTYYLFQMPRWDRRLRIVLDWTVALFFRPDITRVELRVERDQVAHARQSVARAAAVDRQIQAWVSSSTLTSSGVSSGAVPLRSDH